MANSELGPTTEKGSHPCGEERTATVAEREMVKFHSTFLAPEMPISRNMHTTNSAEQHVPDENVAKVGWKHMTKNHVW